MLNRRRFLSGTAGLAAGTYVAAMSAGVGAIPPIVRNGQPKFKFSVAAYSYRGLLTGSSPELALSDFVADCANMGLEGTELTSYYFPKVTTPEYLRALKKQCFELGLDISGTAVGNDFGHPEG